MKLRIAPLFVFLTLLGAVGTAQESVRVRPSVEKKPVPVSTPVKTGGTLRVSREKRAEAYRRLLEGQRYIWTARRTRSGLARRTATRLARESLRKAVELNPRLAEAYTALAELSLRDENSDIDEAISLSTIAVSIDPNNLGGHTFLGRLYTVKSGLRRGKINSEYATKAIKAWSQVGRLDRRNAEAWAFLSIFYQDLRRPTDRVGALRNWLASANPQDSGFYLMVTREKTGLAPENAAVLLGEALLETNEPVEALTVLSRAISDNPSNLRAIDLLGRALETAPASNLQPTIEALRQAVFSNPKNVSLIQMLSETLAKRGEIDDAEKVVREGVSKLRRRQAAGLLMALGDIFSDSERVDKAIKAYREGLAARGVRSGSVVADADRGFTLLLIDKMVHALQRSGRVVEAEKLIEESRGLFSVDDFVMDREKASLMRATGRRREALTLIRSLRQKAPEDYNLMREEAELLTDLGQVDEAAALIVPLIEVKPTDGTRSIKYDDFVNRLFIAGLYLKAGVGEKARFHAEKALRIAKGDQSRQLASLRIASAELIAGDYVAAEGKLKEILEMTPDNPMALNDLGSLYLFRNMKFKEALGLVERAVRIDPRNPGYLDTLGLAHFKLGNLDKAEKFLRMAIRYDFNLVSAFENLGDVMNRKGKQPEAQSYWSRALTIAVRSEDVARIKGKIGR